MNRASAKNRTAASLLLLRRSSQLRRQTDKEGRPLANLRLEPNFAVVFFDHYGIGKGKSLASPFADLLGGEEWIEDFALNRCWNSSAGVMDGNFHRVALGPGAHRNLTLFAFLHFFLNGVRRVHDQVENNLIDVSGIAHDRGQ